MKLPRPHFVVFSGGTEDTPDHSVLKLSDAFEGAGSAGTPKDVQPVLELVADVYNINSGHNSAIQEACSSLKGYSEFVSRVRKNQQVMPLREAVNKAVDECIHDGILADFLRDTKAEVVGVSIFEFDREEHERQEREDVAYDTKIATAKNMIRMGFSTEQIAQATELPLPEVAAL